MTKNKNGTMRKLAALFVMVIILASSLLVLSSCAGDKKIPAQGEMSEAEYAAYVLNANNSYKITFLAASRGNDITSEDYKEEEAVNGEPNTEAAKKALISAIENSKFKKGEDKSKLNSYAENLTDSQVKDIAKELGNYYETDADPGIFQYILIGVGKALGWLTGIFANQYILAIMVFALVIEILMLPIAIKQQKNSIGMAKLRPKMMKIEKKYAGRTDQATMRKKQEEMMELQRSEGYSPFSGCLPLILQLIVVGFILYPIIQNPLRYMLDGSEAFSQALISYATSSKSIGGLGMTLSSKGNVIELLSVLNAENIEGIKSFALISNGQECYDEFIRILPDIPNFTIGKINLGEVPKILDWLVIVPILNVAIQWVSMKLTRKWMGNNNPAAASGGDNSQMNASLKIMDIMMPLMTLVIMFQVPALIGVYWLFRSAVSLLKQFIIKNALPIPKYTEAELKEMEKLEKERQKAEKAIIKTQPKYRSLHYIDEDDYDELPEIKGGNSANTNKNLGSEKPEIKD